MRKLEHISGSEAIQFLGLIGEGRCATPDDWHLEPGEPFPIQCLGKTLGTDERCPQRLRFRRGGVQTSEPRLLYYWHAPHSLYCPECDPRTRAEHAARRLAARKAEVGVPEDLRGYELPRTVVRGRRESWEHFETRRLALPEPHLALDEWNTSLHTALCDYQLGGHSFWIWGHVGSGKSTFAAALVDKLLRADPALDVLWKVEAQLLDEFAGCYASERKALKHRVWDSQVLVLDDFAASERFTDAEFDDIQDILVKFTEAGAYRKKLLVVTSNEALTSDKISGRYADRVMSRLLGLCGRKQWKLAGWDFRSGRDMRNAEQKAQIALLREKVMTGGGGEAQKAGRVLDLRGEP